MGGVVCAGGGLEGNQLLVGGGACGLRLLEMLLRGGGLSLGGVDLSLRGFYSLVVRHVVLVGSLKK